jgi:hypothetical protein
MGECHVKLYVTPECHNLITTLMGRVPIEFSMIGKLEPLQDGLILSQLHLPLQECTGSTTDINDSELMDLQSDHDGLNFWFHSHVNMPAFWSGTDEDTINKFSKGGFVLAMVMNKAGEYKISYQQNGNKFFPAGVRIDNIKMEIIYPDYPITQAQIDEKVKVKVWKPTTLTGILDTENFKDWQNEPHDFNGKNRDKKACDTCRMVYEIDEINTEKCMNCDGNFKNWTPRREANEYKLLNETSGTNTKRKYKKNKRNDNRCRSNRKLGSTITSQNGSH